MIKNVIIGILMAAVLILTNALVRTENQRYAMSIGMCSGSILPDDSCLSRVETRTAWWWHVNYALKN